MAAFVYFTTVYYRFSKNGDESTPSVVKIWPACKLPMTFSLAKIICSKKLQPAPSPSSRSRTVFPHTSSAAQYYPNSSPYQKYLSLAIAASLVDGGNGKFWRWYLSKWTKHDCVVHNPIEISIYHRSTLFMLQYAKMTMKKISRTLCHSCLAEVYRWRDIKSRIPWRSERDESFFIAHVQYLRETKIHLL